MAEWTLQQIHEAVGSTPPTPSATPLDVVSEEYSDEYIIRRYPSVTTGDDVVVAITDGLGMPVECYRQVRHELVRFMAHHPRKFDDVYTLRAKKEEGETFYKMILARDVPGELFAKAAALVYKAELIVLAETTQKSFYTFDGRPKSRNDVLRVDPTIRLAFHPVRDTCGLLRPVTVPCSPPKTATPLSLMEVDSSLRSTMEAASVPSAEPFGPPSRSAFPFKSAEEFKKDLEVCLARTVHGRAWLAELQKPRVLPPRTGIRTSKERGLSFYFAHLFPDIMYAFYGKLHCVGCLQKPLLATLPFFQLQGATEDNVILFAQLCFCEGCSRRATANKDRRHPESCPSNDPLGHPGTCSVCLAVLKSAAEEYMRNVKGIEQGTVDWSDPLQMGFLEIYLHTWDRPADYYAWTPENQKKWLLTKGLLRYLSSLAGAKSEWWASRSQKLASEASTEQTREWQEEIRVRYHFDGLRPSQLVTINTITFAGIGAATIAINAAGQLRACHVLHAKDLEIPAWWTPPANFAIKPKLDCLSHDAKSYSEALAFLEETVDKGSTDGQPTQYLHDRLVALPSTYFAARANGRYLDRIRLASFGSGTRSMPVNATYGYSKYQNMQERLKEWVARNQNAKGFELLQAAIFFTEACCIRRNIVYAYHYSRWTDLGGNIYPANFNIITKEAKTMCNSVAGYSNRAAKRDNDREGFDDSEDGEGENTRGTTAASGQGKKRTNTII